MKPQGMLVRFDIPPIKGIGRICGAAINAIPLMGNGMIVEVLESTGIDKATYPYTHIVVYDSQMTVLEQDR